MSLKNLINLGDLIVVPGALDAITASSIRKAGFDALYVTGAGTSLSYGYPDVGLLTMTEMVANARRIARSVDIPVICDADTGYGNELNVFRTVQEFEAAGAEAIQLEDQVFPKRCGHTPNKEVTSANEFLVKIRAACAARKSSDLLIIARTDARSVLGFENAIERANMALDAGADVAFVEAPQTLEEVAAVPKQVNGPCLLNIVSGGKTPPVTISQARTFGYAIAIVPGLLIEPVLPFYDQLLADLRDRETLPQRALGPEAVFARFGASEWEHRRTAFRTSPDGVEVEAEK